MRLEEILSRQASDEKLENKVILNLNAVIERRGAQNKFLSFLLGGVSLVAIVPSIKILIEAIKTSGFLSQPKHRTTPGIIKWS